MQVEELAEVVEGLEEGGTNAGEEPMGEREEMMRRNLGSLEAELSALNRDVNILQRQCRCVSHNSVASSATHGCTRGETSGRAVGWRAEPRSG